MERLIDEVIVNRAYRVYSTPRGCFKVVNRNNHGAEYTQSVVAAVVKYVQQKLRGRTVSVEETKELLETAPASLKLPYSYGHKLRFYAQSALLILVALEKASHKRSGRKFLYTVKSELKRNEGHRRREARFASH